MEIGCLAVDVALTSLLNVFLFTYFNTAVDATRILKMFFPPTLAAMLIILFKNPPVSILEIY